MANDDKKIITHTPLAPAHGQTAVAGDLLSSLRALRETAERTRRRLRDGD